MKRQALQTTLFPDLPRTAFKPEPGPMEKDFMDEVRRLAGSMGLPSVHIEYFCNNKFFVECPCCGHKTLAHCRKSNNKENAGLPDLMGIRFGLEVKRNGFEPSVLQTETIERLRKAGIPCLVVSPGNQSEAVKFLKTFSEIKG